MKSCSWLVLHLFAGLAQFALGHYVEATLPVGSGPVALCYDSRDCKVYCASEVTRTITVIDGVTNRILRTIPIGYGVRALCYNSLDNKVYCACFNSGEVLIIECTNDSVRKSVNAGSADAIIYEPANNQVYFSNVSGPSTLVIDGQTDEVIAYLPAGAGLHGFGFNPTDNKVYCGGGGSVYVIDATANQVVRTVPTGANTWWICHDPTHDKVYCGSYNGGTVTVLDGATDSVLTTVTPGPRVSGLAWCERRNTVYVDVLDANVVRIIRTTGDSLLPRDIPAGDWPWRMCYAAETDELYCADNRGNTVAVIDGSADTLMHLVPVGRKPSALAWNPVWQRLYVANYDNATVSIIRDTLLGIEEANPDVATKSPMATFAGGSLLLRGSIFAVLVDVSGRAAATLSPGRNRVGHLRRGVYFVRSLGSPETCKVTILR